MKPNRPTFLLFAVLLALCAFSPLAAFAQERVVQLTPSGAIDEPKTFLPATGIEVAIPAVAVTSTTAAGSTAIFTVPAGAPTDPTYVGGLPQAHPPVTLAFYVTSVAVETTQATTLTAGAVVRVGNQVADANVLASTTLASTATTGSFQSLPTSGGVVLHTGDVVTFKITTGATATSQAVKVHLRGFYH